MSKGTARLNLLMCLCFWCIEGLVGVSEVDANRNIIPQELGTRRLKRVDKIAVVHDLKICLDCLFLREAMQGVGRLMLENKNVGMVVFVDDIGDARKDNRDR